MKRVLTAALLTFSTAALAGPTAMKDAGTEQGADGRTFSKLEISCSNTSEPRTVVQFEGSKEWCLADNSYCSKKKIKAAKKACKQK